jgi:hypothetical protein
MLVKYIPLFVPAVAPKSGEIDQHLLLQRTAVVAAAALAMIGVLYKKASAPMVGIAALCLVVLTGLVAYLDRRMARITLEKFGGNAPLTAEQFIPTLSNLDSLSELVKKGMYPTVRFDERTQHTILLALMNPKIDLTKGWNVLVNEMKFDINAANGNGVTVLGKLRGIKAEVKEDSSKLPQNSSLARIEELIELLQNAGAKIFKMHHIL